MKVVYTLAERKAIKMFTNKYYYNYAKFVTKDSKTYYAAYDCCTGDMQTISDNGLSSKKYSEKDLADLSKSIRSIKRIHSEEFYAVFRYYFDKHLKGNVLRVYDNNNSIKYEVLIGDYNDRSCCFDTIRGVDGNLVGGFLRKDYLFNERYDVVSPAVYLVERYFISKSEQGGE